MSCPFFICRVGSLDDLPGSRKLQDVRVSLVMVQGFRNRGVSLLLGLYAQIPMYCRPDEQLCSRRIAIAESPNCLDEPSAAAEPEATWKLHFLLVFAKRVGEFIID